MSTALALKNMISLLNSGITYLAIKDGNIFLTCLQREMGERNWQIRYMASSFYTGLVLFYSLL